MVRNESYSNADWNQTEEIDVLKDADNIACAFRKKAHKATPASQAGPDRLEHNPIDIRHGRRLYHTFRRLGGWSLNDRVARFADDSAGRHD
jgi:hypothetical protein